MNRLSRPFQIGALRAPIWKNLGPQSISTRCKTRADEASDPGEERGSCLEWPRSTRAGPSARPSSVQRSKTWRLNEASRSPSVEAQANRSSPRVFAGFERAIRFARRAP